MYNVLVVDDEEIICDGLKVILDWNKLDLQVLDHASNGKSALEKLEYSNFHLIITDIRMPVLDGLEFIDRVVKKYPNIKIIIISGYKDFEYAKQAIKLGVKSYLLKPINYEELMQTVKTIKVGLDNELVYESIIKESSNVMKNQWLYDLSCGNLTFDEISSIKTSYFNIIKRDTYCVALIEINNFFNIIDVNLESAKLLKRNVKELVQQIVEKENLGYVYDDNSGVLGVILCQEYNLISSGWITTFFSGIVDIISKRLNVAITISYGSPVSKLSNLKISRKIAIHSLEKKIFFPGHDIIPYKKTQDENVILLVDWDEHSLLQAVECLNVEDIQKEIDKLLEEIVIKQITNDNINGLIYSIILKLSQLLKKYHENLEKIPEFNDIHKHKNLEQLHAWLIDICTNSSKLIHSLAAHKKKTKLIEQILDYINNNYFDEISLNTISSIFYLNTAYIGQLFKDTIGDTFNNYLNKKRISEAKKMFMLNNFKLKGVIEKVGYKNPEYFYRQFKKFEGVSFIEYKKENTV